MRQSDKEFLEKIRDAIFSNPFGQTRTEIDRAATGLAPNAETGEVLARLIHKVGETVLAVQRQMKENKTVLSQEEKTLLQYGKLFHVFHLFCDDIDSHIRDQVVKGEEKCKAGFASGLLASLYNYGFSNNDAVRFLELFFQMRRAFYFIQKIAGSSNCVMNLRRVLWNNVFTSNIKLYDEYLWNRMEDFSTMILGETGTGKGMAAAAIGRSGYIPFDPKSETFRESFVGTFISINLSQYPEQLIESELFGHKKGAFTGAVEAHKGIFSRCSPHGSIFLDELGDVSPHIQIKLLRVLQERLFTPVGSHKSEKFHGRVIGATNQSLTLARQQGKFRDDFYYRLCSDVIEVPPLRQRIDENPKELREILDITVRRILGCESEKTAASLHSHIISHQPPKYHWPGNIRELEQCVRQILLNERYSWQQPPEKDSSQSTIFTNIENGTLTAAQLLSKYCRIQHAKHGTYEAVAKLTGLDRRTVKKYITQEH